MTKKQVFFSRLEWLICGCRNSGLTTSLLSLSPLTSLPNGLENQLIVDHSCGTIIFKITIQNSIPTPVNIGFLLSLWRLYVVLHSITGVANLFPCGLNLKILFLVRASVLKILRSKYVFRLLFIFLWSILILIERKKKDIIWKYFPLIWLLQCIYSNSCVQDLNHNCHSKSSCNCIRNWIFQTLHYWSFCIRSNKTGGSIIFN
jgi:hypothetical protein